MQVKLLGYTKNPQLLCVAAAKTCYSEDDPITIMGNIDRANEGKFLEGVLGRGHESVIEHASFTFAVCGVSRSLTHQLVRHRIASYSQQSQRYVLLSTPTFVMPPSVGADPEAREEFLNAMMWAWEAYNVLAKLVPTEDARYVLPNACTTNIVVTMNARELRHLFSLRLCNRAQWEIREMVTQMFEQAKAVAPGLFKGAGPGCARGPCPEGKNSCGRPWVEPKRRRAAGQRTIEDTAGE